MKKLILAVTSVALLAVSCNNNQTGSNSGDGADDTVTIAEVSSQIAYVNLEQIMERYDLVIDLGSAFEERATKADNEITAKRRSLERAVADAQEKVEKGLVTRAQAAELQEKLQRQEQSFYQYGETMQAELAEENQVMMNNIYHSLTSFIEEFNSDHRYGVILTTSGISPVLHADPRLDITELVIDGLNARYAQEKKNAPKE